MNLDLLKTITILYVEDEISLQEEICLNISPFVKEIIKANNGEDGLEAFKNNKNKIDLIVSDILMPSMNGIDMVNSIREIDKEIPVIYTTAFNDVDYMKKTIEQSIISYTVKPIDVEQLLKSIVKASTVIENIHLKTKLENINKELEAKVALKTKKLREQNTKLNEQLYTDDLTGLSNRKALIRDIKEVKQPVLSFIDIDAFKSINDLYGEKIGNNVLSDVGVLLKQISTEYNCNLYRIGSDEFVLLRDSSFDEQKCLEVIKLIISSINKHNIYIEDSEITIRIDVTIGISKDKEDTLQKAGMALKKAKEERIAYKIYDESCSLDSEYQNDIKWTKEIEKAIKTNNVVAYFQPIVDKDENIIKYEALMRLRDGDNIYSPYLFLDIAKRVKFYPQLAKIMIEKSFDKALQTQKSININLSIEDMENSEIINFIKAYTNSNDISNLITFEILESENISDYEKIFNFISVVRECGCTIAIDDFGSGYSNFSYLLKLRPDYIKIDGSLIKNIDKDQDSFTVTKMINDISHLMGMKTVAEFVHSKEVYDILKEIGIDQYQGFYFSEPKENF